jgi:hypothetical protein
MIFPLTSVSRSALGSTQFNVQWVPGVLSLGVKSGRGVTLTTHPPSIAESWMGRSYNSSPPCAYIGVLWDCFTFTQITVRFHIICNLLLQELETIRKTYIYGTVLVNRKCGTCGWSGREDKYRVQSLLGCTVVYSIGCRPKFQKCRSSSN